MKLREIALIASVLILPTQQLLAASVSQKVVQSTNAKATIALPIHKALPINKAVKPVITRKSAVMVPGNTVIAPNNLGTKLNKVKLSGNQRLLLTNGKSIVKNGSNGLNIIGVNKAVQSAYKNALLFKDNKKSVWIKVKGKQSKVGVFARIENSNIKPLLGMKSTLNLSKRPLNKALGVSASKPTSPNASLHNYEKSPENVQEGPGDSGSNIRHAKTDEANLEDGAPLKEFRSFNVVSDSVVAEAVVVVDSNHQTIFIHWGDGEVDTFNPHRPRPTGGTNEHVTNQPDAFKFRHVYKTPVQPMNKYVSVTGQNFNGDTISSSSKAVEINPRYTFIIYPVQLEINDHLDHFTETHSELYVYMNVTHNNQLKVGKEWNEDIKTGSGTGEGIIYPVNYSLGEGSRLNLEVNYQDEPVKVYFRIKEKDNWVKSIWDVVSNIPVRFDGSNSSSYFPGFHPKDFTGSKEYIKTYTIGIGNGDGTITVVLSTEMNLIIPATSTDEGGSRFNRSMAR